MLKLISTLKAYLGIGAGRPGTSGTSIRVEAEADASSERAVKEPVQEFDAGPEADGEPESEASDAPVDSLSGIGPTYRKRLNEAGIETVQDLSAADASALAEATDIGQGRLEDWIVRAGHR